MKAPLDRPETVVPAGSSRISGKGSAAQAAIGPAAADSAMLAPNRHKKYDVSILFIEGPPLRLRAWAKEKPYTELIAELVLRAEFSTETG
jgi:hypothetical protein